LPFGGGNTHTNTHILQCWLNY